MPNHVDNQLKLTAVGVDCLHEVLNSVKGECDGKTLAFDFNRLIPMPELLVGSVSGSLTGVGERILAGEDLTTRYDDATREKAVRIAKAAEQAVRECGYPDWYEWSVANWGTKWNAYDTKVGEIEPWEGLEWASVTVRFNTAWSVPEPVIAKLTSMFPDLEISGWALDEGANFACNISASEGNANFYYLEARSSEPSCWKAGCKEGAVPPPPPPPPAEPTTLSY